MLKLTCSLVLILMLGAGCSKDGALAPTGPSQEPDRVQVQFLLIGFGHSVPGRSLSRNQLQANLLAYELFSRASHGEEFLQLAQQYSDGGAQRTIDILNTYVPPDSNETPRGALIAGFTLIAFSIDVGQVGLVPYDPNYDARYCPYGYFVIKRTR